MNNPNAEKLEEMLSKFTNQPLEKELLLNLSKDEKDAALLAAELKSIPLLNAPRATVRRKYAIAGDPVPFWQKLIFSFRFSLTAAAFLLIIFTGGIAFSAAGSLPGERLFGLKKTAEQFRIKFALTDTQRAYLQLQIAKKRLSEAQKIVNSRNPQATLMAIKEVSEATELAANEIQTLSLKSIKESSRPLLSSLENIGQQEKDLVSGLAQNGNEQEGKEDVIALSLKNQTKVSEIKRSVAISTAEEAMASLSDSPSTVTISGYITQIGKAGITVEKTVFSINEETIISGQDETMLSLLDLDVNSKVAISGQKNQTEILALKITVLEQSNNQEAAGEVKGETTQTSLPASTTPSSILGAPNEEPAHTETNQATGSFIIEDPNPQFIP